MGSPRLWSPAGTRRTANRSERKQTPTKKSPPFKKNHTRLVCHSNPKSNALSGFLSVKSANLHMMSTDQLPPSLLCGEMKSAFLS